MLDSHVLFANQQAIADGTAVNSTYVLDAGLPYATRGTGGAADTATAPKLFAGEGQEVIVEVTAAANTGKDDYQILAKVVAADDDALTSNAVILDTFTTAAIAETALPTAKKPLVIKLHPAGQTAAKRYYGVIFDLTGTGSALTSTVNAYCRGFGEHQTNMIP